MQPSGDAMRFVVGGALLVVATLVGLTAAGTLIGALLGAAAGLAVGVLTALLTLGASLFLGPVVGGLLGAGLGAALGGLVGLRLCVLWAEVGLLYHPQRYTGEPFPGDLWQLGGRIYALRKVPYALPRWVGGNLAQSGFLLVPQGTGARVLWVLFGGNAMLATDWLTFCERLMRLESHTTGSVAFLLFDYPGYGANAGQPGPGEVLEASHGALRAALATLDGQAVEVNLLGHSLGAAAASQLAVRLKRDGIRPGRLVMTAPFLSVPHVVSDLVWPPQLPWPLQWLGPIGRRLLPGLLAALIPHRWANMSSVRAAARAGWRIGIVHGLLDVSVPASHGRELHRLATEAAALGKGPETTYIEVPGAGHNDLLFRALPECLRLMGFEGKNA